MKSSSVSEETKDMKKILRIRQIGWKIVIDGSLIENFLKKLTKWRLT